MRNDENEEIADWLLRLTAFHKRWGFGLCFLYLRNVKGFGCIASIRTRYTGSGSDY
jgi:putative transposase